MSTDLFETVVVPIADPDDARRTARAINPYLSADSVVIVTHVVPKGGGVPDKASVEQREEYAERAYEEFFDEFGSAVDEVTPLTLYGRNVAETIADGAIEAGATAIVFVPREASRWAKLLSGDVSERLISGSDVPVVALPGDEEDGD